MEKDGEPDADAFPKQYSEVDELLIGGIKLRIDNIYLDASIKSQINNVKLDLMKT